MSDLETLISMGFSKERAQKALSETDNAGIELALEWLFITDVDSECSTPNMREKPPDPTSEELPHETTCNTKSGLGSNTPVNSNKTSRILVRLLNGKQISKTFNATNRFNDVLLWIRSMNSTEKFGLMTNFPKKVFTVDEYGQTLDELNLVPSAVLIATQPEKWSDLKEYRETKDYEEKRRVEEAKRKKEVDEQLKERQEESTALARVRRQIEDDKAARRRRWPNLYNNSGQPLGNQLQLQNRSKRED